MSGCLELDRLAERYDEDSGLADLGLSDPELAFAPNPWADVFAEAPEIRVSAGVVFNVSHGRPGLHYLTEGRIRHFLVSSGGSEKTFCIVNPGAMFGEVTLVEGRPNPWFATPVCDSTVRFIAAAVAKRLMAERPELALGVISSLVRKLRMAGKQIGDLSFRSVPSRVACVVLARCPSRLGTGTDAVGKPAPVRLTHDEIAQFVGSNRVSVTRALREMQEAGLLDYDRSLENVHIFDRDGLTAVASREA